MVLVFLSPAYLNSKNCNLELQAAYEYDKPFVVMKFPGVDVPPKPNAGTFAADLAACMLPMPMWVGVEMGKPVPEEALLRGLAKSGVAAAAGGGGGAAALPAAMAALRVGGGGARSPQRGAAPAPAPRELPTAAMGAARVVALMGAGAADAGVARAGAEALEDIARSDAGQAACVAAGAPRAVVAALTTPAGVTAVRVQGCRALANISLSEAGEAACVAAGAPRAVVAALTAHAGVATS